MRNRRNRTARPRDDSRPGVTNDVMSLVVSGTMSKVRQPADPPQHPADDDRLDELLEILRRMEARQIREAQRQDEYRRVYLRARFPYGRPTDRWGR